MSLDICLPDLIEQGLLPERLSAEARALYDELLAKHSRTGSREAAQALASKEVLEALERQVTRKQFLAGKTIAARTRIAADLQNFGLDQDGKTIRDALSDLTGGRIGGGGGRGGSGGRGGDGASGPIPPDAGPAIITRDPRARFSSVEGRRKAILADSDRMMQGILGTFSADLLGRTRRPADLIDLVRELFDGKTGNAAAREFATAWRQTAEMLRKRFNAAGGDIGYRADWGLPQSHDWKKVRAAGFAEWRLFIIDLLDPARMIDQRTGLPMTRETLENALPEIFETIRSRGANKRSPSGQAVGKSLANQRSEERFFVFRDADSWLQYNARFGSGSAYDAMVGHIESMSREIAAMEVLGPNPPATLEWIKQSLTKSAATDTSPGTQAIDRATTAGKAMDDLWAEYTGANLDPRHQWLAVAGASYRSLAVARMLGGAFLTSMSDFAFSATRRAFNGLSRKIDLAGYARAMAPFSGPEHQKMLARRGLLLEEWRNRTAAQSRIMMDELTGEIPRRMAEFVLRASLLSRSTQSQRLLFGGEMFMNFTEAAGKDWATLDPPLRNTLRRYGIDADGWEQMRHAPMDVEQGVEWIAPHRWDNRDLADRFLEMVQEEADIAIPVADLRARAVQSTNLQRGTLIGELGRSGPLLFKTFGISVILRQSAEIMAMQPAQAARYAGGLFIGTTLAGAVSLQLKALAEGKDPRPVLDDDFLGAAMLTGGGFGIFGDFLFAAEARNGRGIKDTAAGPLGGDIQDLINLARDKHPERRATRVAKGFVPGNNLWYTRAAFDRMVADQIQEAIDPDFRKSHQRLQRTAAEQGTDFFWRPGDPLPRRLPDFSNALAEPPPDEE